MAREAKEMIVAIVGLPGAGKTLAADFFRKKNLPILRFGQITDDEIRFRGLPLTQESEKEVRENLRHTLGMAAYAKKMEPKISEALKYNQIIIIDGLRSWEEYTYLKDKFSRLILLTIYAAPQIRYARLHNRSVRRLEIKEARERDIAELTKLNMGPPIAIADYLIKNEGSLADFARELQNFLATLTPNAKG